jgi:hypothetical protein
VFIQALVAKAAVEALDLCVFHRLAGTDGVQPQSVLVSPGIVSAGRPKSSHIR